MQMLPENMTAHAGRAQKKQPGDFSLGCDLICCRAASKPLGASRLIGRAGCYSLSDTLKISSLNPLHLAT